MPESLEELLALLDLETIEVGLFRGLQPATRLQRVFGGQVLAQALVAATRTVDPGYPVHSLHAYFLLPGDPSVPIVYDVERLRDGRSFQTRRVVARQHGRPIFYTTASFHADEPGVAHQDPMPDAPRPEDCPSLADVLGAGIDSARAVLLREWAALSVRYVGDSRPSRPVLTDPAHPAVARVWVRADGEMPADPGLHACVLAYASDLTLLGASLVVHDTYIGAPGVQAASLDHAMWFHRPFRADEWLLYDQVSPSASAALGFSTGRVFTADGVLAATVAQQGLVRVRRGPEG